MHLLTSVLTITLVVVVWMMRPTDALSISCSGGTVGSATTITAQPATINNCAVNAALRVNVPDMATSAGAGTTPLEFVLNGSTISDPNYLLLNGYSTSAAADSATHPFFATVTYNTFVSGMIGFYNHFPPGTIIAVRYNSLNQLNSNTYTTQANHYHMFETNGLSLRGGSHLMMEYNDVLVTHPAHIQGLLILNGYSILSGSVWSLSNNKINLTALYKPGNCGAYIIYVFSSGTDGTVDSSKFLFSNNTILAKSTLISALFLSTELNQKFSTSSVFEIDNNDVTSYGGTENTCGFIIDYGYLGVYYMTATTNSRISISNNNMNLLSSGTTTSRVTAISLGQTVMSVGSELAVENNVLLMPLEAFTDVSGILFNLDTTLSSGNININSNRMITCPNTKALVYVPSGKQFKVNSGGIFLFTRNSVERDASCAATGVPPLLSGTVAPTGTGVFYLCPWNRYGDTVQYQPSDYTTAMITSYAVATDVCFTPTNSHTHSLAPTPTPTPTLTHVPTPSASVAHTSTPTPMATESVPLTHTVTSTMTAKPTPTTTATTSAIPTHSPSQTPTHPRTRTPTPTPTLPIPPTTTTSTTISPSIPTSPSGSLSVTAISSQSVSTSLSRSLSSSLTGTSFSTISLTTSRTEERTESSTYAANTTLVGQMLAQFPLFTDVAVDDNTVRSGSTRSLTPNYNSPALWELLAKAGGSRMRVTGIPIVAALPALGPVGVTGNEGGFFLTQPNTTLLVPNITTLNLTMSALPQYSITVGERLLLYTSVRKLLGIDVLSDHRDVDEPHLVGTIIVSKGDTGMSGPSITTTIVTGGGGALGGMAAELQGVGALALMGCSDPNTKSSFGSYRVLSPVAVQDSYAGAIIGNALVTGTVGVVQLGIVLVLRFCRRVQRTVEQMATARFPSFFIAAALAFHTGTAFASAQLISQPGNYAGWEVFVGVAGFVYSLVLPVAMAAHPYLRVNRAYQEYNMAEWLGARRWPAWIVWVVPRGALFSLETRQAYGLYLSAYRAPPRQVFWTSLPTWTPLVFLVAGLFHPNTIPGCRAQFACMGIAMVVIAVLVVWRAPLRAHVAGWLDATSRLALGCVMFCMGAAIVDGDTLNAQAADAAYAFIVVLMAVTALRVLHHLVCMYMDYLMQRDSVPVEMVWTHVFGGNNKKTLQFHNMEEDDSLRGIASDRNAAGDADDITEIDMPLVEGTSEDELVDVDDEWASPDGASNPPSLASPTSRPQYSGITAFRGSDETDDDVEADTTNKTPPLSSPLSLIEESSSSSSLSSSNSLTPNDEADDDGDNISIESL